MCMCGGILEIGAICALVGYIGKKMHKCDCTCHGVKKIHCEHCDDNKRTIFIERQSLIEKEKMLKKKNLKYKIVQYILGGLTAIGILLVAFSLAKNHCHHHEHNEHCHHVEMKI